MTGAVVLAIVVAAGEAQNPLTTAMKSAAAEALGEGASVVFFEAAGAAEAQVARIEDSSAARAVAVLAWRDPARTQASLRVHVARTDRWLERALTFADADSPIERGRAIGFNIASMLPEADPTLQPAWAPPAADVTLAPRAAEPRRRFAGASFVAGSDVDGVARGLGGALELALPAGDSVAVRLSAGARGGAIASVPASGLIAAFGVGAAWSPWAGAARSWDLALRADTLLIIQAAQHDRSTGESEWKSKPLPGFDALLELDWPVTGGLQAMLAAGLEVALGSVDVTVVTSSGTKTARVPAARGVGQAGLRLAF